MTEEADRKERRLPVRSLHEFLFEISSEWDRFRAGSLINIVLSAAVILVLGLRFLLQWRRGDPVDALITLGIVGVAAFNLYNGWRQHKFYARWEKRIGLIMHTEEELLGGDG